MLGVTLGNAAAVVRVDPLFAANIDPEQVADAYRTERGRTSDALLSAPDAA
jgi:hypothetical protein